ncbi:MAG: alpha/beta hydrolase, partial [Casimicrobiaceae bacterium]
MSDSAAADLRGLSRLTLDAVAGVVGLVEAMHYNIASLPGTPGAGAQRRTTGITGLVYRGIGGVVG